MSLRRPAVFAHAIVAFWVGCLAAAPAVMAAGHQPDMFETFNAPPPSERPFVRWWWNGARIKASELERQLDVLQAAGIGGVEINTIAMPVLSQETRLEDHPEVPWLSAEWCRLVRLAAEGARRRGLTADLLVGSGWPLGGRFLPVDQQTQRVRVRRQVVQGPASFRWSREELMRFAPPAHEASSDEVEPGRSQLLFVRLLPTSVRRGDFAPGIECLKTDDDSVVAVEVPTGEHEILVGVRDWGFTQVKLGAPGADGPVLDHFSAPAVRAYFDHMTAELAPVLGGRLGHHLRALFVDSIELDYANWTGDLPAEFARRRGYVLTPYLPFVLEPETAPPSSPFDRTVQQARYDFNRTLVELFQERFIGTFVAFCREQGVLARLQAYGRETHPLHGSMLVDLPEGESWLWHDRSRSDGVQQADSTGANKYVSSGAHLTDQRRVSFEAMTSAVAPFQEALADFKLVADRSFLDGVNHPILHGYNYSPPEVGLPGWVRFGSYFSEQNPWWPALRDFTDYAARVGSVLRNSLHQAEVAILAPQADEWGRFGRLYQPFPEVRHPWYLYELPRAIHHAGNGTDFISERVIQDAAVRGGRLGFGPQQYALVVLTEVASIEPATLRSLLAFAQDGGRLVILGEAPSRSSGLRPDRSADPDAEVQALSAQLLALGEPHVRQIEPPAYVDRFADEVPPSHRKIGRGAPLLRESFAAMVPWAREWLDRAGVEAHVRLAPLSPHLSQVRHVTDSRQVYFFANRSREDTVRTTATFPAATGTLWHWDPETGARAPVQGDPQRGIPLVLPPLASLLLVFDETAPADASGAIRLDADPGAEPVAQRLHGPWRVDLSPAGGGPGRQLNLERLQDLAWVPETEDFGGVVQYQLTFTTPEPDARSVVDLGTVHGLNEVSLNGQALGRRWHGPALYPTAGALRPGQNELVVTVRTHLSNHVRAKRDDPAAQRWASWYPRIPNGMIGPVVLRRAADR